MDAQRKHPTADYAIGRSPLWHDRGIQLRKF